MPDIILEQALYGDQDAGGYRFLGRSPGFRDDWLPEAERLCTGFGERPAGVRCPACIYAQSLGKQHVAIIQVADQGTDDTGRPGALGFYLLSLSRSDYALLGGDPFQIADRHPPPWEARGDLRSLTWTGGPLPPRTIAQIQEVLQRPGGPSLFEEDVVPQGGSQVLLGGCQILVDGGRLVLERPAPDTSFLRALWMLLPTRTRIALWPASFAFGNALRFHVLVVPRIEGDSCTTYKTEAEAADYPESHYELALQSTAESGTQEDLDALFARRSQNETLRLAVIVLIVILVLTALIRLVPTLTPDTSAARPTAPEARSALDLPPAEQYPTLGPAERAALTESLEGLAKKRNLAAPPGATAEQLVEAIDRHLGTPDRQRDPGPLTKQGPVQRQVRVLLWKHHIAAYGDARLNPAELVERLQQRVETGKASSKKDAP
jgi:hypothetical protein